MILINFKKVFRIENKWLQSPTECFLKYFNIRNGLMGINVQSQVVTADQMGCDKGRLRGTAVARNSKNYLRLTKSRNIAW